MILRVHLLDSFTCTIISTFTCWLQQLQDVKCSALQSWDHAALQHCSTAAGCLQSLKLPLRPTPVTCHLCQEYNIEHRHSRHSGQTLLDWNIICLIDIISPAAGYLLIAKTVQNFLQTCHLLITSQHMLPWRGWVITGIVRSPVQEERDDGVWWGHSSLTTRL